MTNPDVTEEDLELLLARLRRPAIAMLKTTDSSEMSAPGCWFGGQPTLPEDVEWPLYNVPDTDIVFPLHFLVQINLAYLPHIMGLPSLPKVGTLFVFYEYLVAPIDESESALQTGEALRVVYVEQDVSNCPRRESPPMPETSSLPFDLQMDMSEENLIFRKSENFHFVIFDDYPAIETARSMGITDIPEAYSLRHHNIKESTKREVNVIRYSGSEFPRGYANGPRFDSIFGYFQSQAFPNQEYFDKRKRACIAPVESDHISLFRFVSIGRQFPICFWIRKQDLANQDFSNIFAWEEI